MQSCRILRDLDDALEKLALDGKELAYGPIQLVLRFPELFDPLSLVHAMSVCKRVRWFE